MIIKVKNFEEKKREKNCLNFQGYKNIKKNIVIKKFNMNILVRK